MSSNPTVLDPREAAFLAREHSYLAKIIEKERKLLKCEMVCAAQCNMGESDKTSNTLSSLRPSSLKNCFVDITTNMEILRLRERLSSKDVEISELKREIEAREFHPTAISGQKLLKKCKVLLDENQSLGRQISEGPIQDLLMALSAERAKTAKLEDEVKRQAGIIRELDEENGILTNQLENLVRMGIDNGILGAEEAEEEERTTANGGGINSSSSKNSVSDISNQGQKQVMGQNNGVASENTIAGESNNKHEMRMSNLNKSSTSSTNSDIILEVNPTSRNGGSNTNSTSSLNLDPSILVESSSQNGNGLKSGGGTRMKQQNNVNQTIQSTSKDSNGPPNLFSDDEELQVIHKEKSRRESRKRRNRSKGREKKQRRIRGSSQN